MAEPIAPGTWVEIHCRERQEGEFTRRLRLPASVDQEQIRAEFGNGVMRITLPKIARPQAEDNS